MDNHTLGSLGEDRAADIVGRAGFTILERNYRNGRYGEIDIICQRGSLLVFIEVKSRFSGVHGGALYSITTKKKKSLAAAATRFMAENGFLQRGDVMCRFDLIAIEGRRELWVEDILRIGLS